jgi:hypothetical protein
MKLDIIKEIGNYIYHSQIEELNGLVFMRTKKRPMLVMFKENINKDFYA